MAELSDLTAACIRCGFCLESCPTFKLTGDEAQSPRGRIYLARSMDEGNLDWSRENGRPIDSCVGCLACETACPSGVKYGEILEKTRRRLLVEGQDGLLALMVSTVSSRPMLKGALAVSRFIGPERARRWLLGSDAVADLPQAQPAAQWRPLEEGDLPLVKGDVDLLEGCAMPVLFPRVVEASVRLIRRVGYRATLSRGCCGALHAHAGYLEIAAEHASTHQGFQPLVTNAAGCGSWLKKNRESVTDLTEFLFTNGLSDMLCGTNGIGPVRVSYQDACHLRHGQKVTHEPRGLLGAIPGVDLVELDEPDMCCGSGGVYNLTHPAMAKELLDRKWSAIERSGASIVVTANPGCHAWIAQAAREAGSQVRVCHIAEILEAAFSGWGDPSEAAQPVS